MPNLGGSSSWLEQDQCQEAERHQSKILPRPFRAEVLTSLIHIRCQTFVSWRVAFCCTFDATYFLDFHRYTLLETALEQAKDDAKSRLESEFEDAKEDFKDVLEEEEEEEFEDAKEEQEEERGTKRKREVLHRIQS